MSYENFSMPDFSIDTFDFNTTTRCVDGLDSHRHSRNWPVVYLIYNDSHMYIGETSSAVSRMDQHLQNNARNNLNKVSIIFDDQFNKSAILDIEQALIQLFAADGKYELQNANSGQSRKHDYYQRQLYLNKVDDIWTDLTEKGLTRRSANEIRNSDLFKFSPFNSLNDEQAQVSNEILLHVLDCLIKGNDTTCFVNGGAGTGKSVVLINMIYQLVSAQQYNADTVDVDNDDYNSSDELDSFLQIKNKINQYLSVSQKEALKIAFAFPLQAIRATIKTVFQKTKKGLKSSMVISPTNLKKGDDYDIIFVDESHRLMQYKNISWMGAFKNKCQEFYGKSADPHNYTQLDWIVKCSRSRILVYDANQSVRGSDITKEQFAKALENSSQKKWMLTRQMRCQGGTEYTDFVDKIFSCQNVVCPQFNNYELLLYENIEEMVSFIKEKNSTEGLCRIVSSESWPWNTKNISSDERKSAIANNIYDIEIQGHKYLWNSCIDGWIIKESAIDEVGCIHTVQGFDLNRVGIILGREIDYDETNNCFKINRSLFYSDNIKRSTDDAALKEYIINAYKVMMERGIRGCYIFAYNEALREYLKRFIKVIN